DTWNNRRRAIARRYSEEITNPLICKPITGKGNTHVFYVYVITTENRNGLRKYLEENDIKTGVYFPVPFHKQRLFEGKYDNKEELNNAEYVADHSLAIPMFPELTDEEIGCVINMINGWDGK
ncbi:MAG: DegT/DnrJ/EryC1/StrS family aminotransferase, partial [Lachnospiraceae bacterium]|nr:DegT/DnrJ/EryC1/StrS family aminotransferase [Lachnospiraceae bacterium]